MATDVIVLSEELLPELIEKLIPHQLYGVSIFYLIHLLNHNSTYYTYYIIYYFFWLETAVDHAGLLY